MDNNFNQQVPQNQQPVYQQQAPMYQQPVYQQAPKQPSNFNMTELIGLILAGVGTILAILGSILTCSCSASKTYDPENALSGLAGMFGGEIDLHSMSLVWLLAIFGALIAAAGVVMSIVSLKKNAAVKAGKLAYVAIAVGAFGVVYGILPVLTICGYNCSLDSSYEDSMKSAMSSFGDMFK